MKRLNIKSDLENKINQIIEKYNEESDVSFIIEDIAITGDILDYNNEVDKLSIYLKCSDFYSFFDEREEPELIAEAKREILKIEDFNIDLGLADCPYKNEDISSFFRENILYYKKELLESKSPNIFNDESLRVFFEVLASNQRNLPEHEMREAQKTMGGGILPDLLEHIGDLTHRMAQSTYISRGDIHLGINDMYSKLEKGISALKQGNSFENEVQRNRKSNYNYSKEKESNFNYSTYEKYNEKCNTHLDRYAKEHSKLTIYNEMQYSAKYAAVYIGNGEFEKAYNEIKLLKDSIDDGTYSKKASTYTKYYEYQSLSLIKNKINSKYKNEISKLNITENGDKIKIHDIVIKKSFRGEGIGTEIMKDIIKYAKLNKKLIHLEPNEKDLSYGTKSKQKLIKFYKNLDFKENKGSKKDYDFNSGTMIMDFRVKQKKKLKIK